MKNDKLDLKEKYQEINSIKHDYNEIYEKIMDKINWLKVHSEEIIDEIIYFDNNNKNQKKIIGVLYSGGLDSTFDILNELTKGNCVVPIINIINSDYLLGSTSNEIMKYYCSFKTLKMIGQAFNKPNEMRLFTPIFNSAFQAYSMSSFSYSIQMFNIATLPTLGYNLLKHIDEFHMGLVLEDQGVSYMKEMKDLYYASSKFVVRIDEEYDANNKIKLPILKFPLIKYSKNQIENAVLFLYNKTFNMSDELPIISCDHINLYMKNDNDKKEIIIKACGICDSCLKNKENNIGYGTRIIKIDVSELDDFNIRF